jgi:phosphoserine aminotransferase
MYNFSAGPATLAKSVLYKAQQELLNFENSGCSIMELSHRGALFEKVHNNALSNLRQLLNIPKAYHILFMQGGAITQNALVPMNLLGKKNNACYAISGTWSAKSAAEAKRYGNIHTLFDMVATKTESIQQNIGLPHIQNWHIPQKIDDLAYLHICSNETIDGIEIFDMQNFKSINLPIVADMSSHILSRPINIEDYAVIYAGAQKNIGIAGLTIVIVHESMLGHAMLHCPTALNWQAISNANSMYNTPPTFAIYMAGLVFEWLLAQGGLEFMQIHNQNKAKKLYAYIDESNLYINNVDAAYRSLMNVPFKLKNENLTTTFLEQAQQYGLLGLKGHKSIGGMRASIYNAMPLEGVLTLIDFMQKFEQEYAK